uniref:Uncharacterized protein n=1 Tax=Oryza brachyantha TaxID=4533 RepID=J3KXS4_ORYBR
MHVFSLLLIIYFLFTNISFDNHPIKTELVLLQKRNHFSHQLPFADNQNVLIQAYSKAQNSIDASVLSHCKQRKTPSEVRLVAVTKPQSTDH